MRATRRASVGRAAAEDYKFNVLIFRIMTDKKKMPSQLRGRQKKKDPEAQRTEHVDIRMTKAERRQLDAKAQARGHRLSDYCRCVLFRYKLTDLSPAERKYRQIVSNGCTNLNTCLQTVFKHGMTPELKKEILETIDYLHESKTWTTSK